jgi:hypothetical protein
MLSQIIDRPRKEFRVGRLNWVSGNPIDGLKEGVQVRFR